MAEGKTTKTGEPVSVRTAAGVARRCRAGYLFGPEPVEVVLGPGQLAAVRSDELLVVTELPAKAAAPAAPVTGGTTTGAGNKGMTPAPGVAGRG